MVSNMIPPTSVISAIALNRRFDDRLPSASEKKFLRDCIGELKCLLLKFRQISIGTQQTENY